ncbi:unnamed protein product, partial [Taenia asiatica]|uniref:WD_REPEATS_REGION domain-containing protein n=1 Tax=Taenia asiatica TaxID=60517 RepID=A0A0R3VTW4_TAEAS
FKSSLRTPSRKNIKLVTSGLNECSFEPVNEERYSKETQTTNEVPCETPCLLDLGLFSYLSFSAITTDTWPETPSVVNGPASRAQMSLEWDDELLVVDGDDPLTDMEVPSISNQVEGGKRVRLQDVATPSRNQVKEMTDEDKENIQLSEAFQEFLVRASAMVEDALEEDDRDIFFDYSGADKEEELAKAQQMLTEDCIFFDEFWTSKRVVTALDWSPNHPEIVLAAYSATQREEPALTPVTLYAAAATANGVCLLWNLKSKKPESAPESVFTCQAPITTAIFSNFHPGLIIAGTYVGQIVIWDTRVNRQTPIQWTGLCENTAHWEPIRSIAVTGNLNANTLVSVSADGRLCGWSLDMLAKPFQTIELVHKQAKVVAPTSVAFMRDFDDSFLVGAQDGFIYGGCRSGSEPGITVQFEGHHHAPVTAMSVPSADDPLNDPNIYLTTSMDCTAKVWSRMEKHPLVSFEDRNDYLLHCDWSPSHPALFATVALTGHLDIWNLNMNREVPTASTVLSNDAAPNCCKFERKGSHIVVGDDSGRIRIFAINDKIASPRTEDWTVLTQHIQQLMEIAKQEEKTDSMMREFDFSDL